MAGQKSRRPQLVRIVELLGLPARQVGQPCLGFHCDRRHLSGMRAIIQRRHRAFHRSPLDAALDRLVMQSERLAHRVKRRVLPISQQNPRPLDPARRFRSRLRDRLQSFQIRICERQLDCPTPRCHNATSFGHSPQALYRSLKPQMNPPHMTTFMESIV